MPSNIFGDSGIDPSVYPTTPQPLDYDWSEFNKQYGWAGPVVAYEPVTITKIFTREELKDCIREVLQEAGFPAQPVQPTKAEENA